MKSWVDDDLSSVEASKNFSTTKLGDQLREPSQPPDDDVDDRTTLRDVEVLQHFQQLAQQDFQHQQELQQQDQRVGAQDFSSGDMSTEDKINRILSDAHKEMQQFNGCMSPSEHRLSTPQSIRPTKRKHKGRWTGSGYDYSFKNKRFFHGPCQPNNDKVTPVASDGNATTTVTCDSSNNSNKNNGDDEKKKATKELISRIYMKELERLVENAEKRGETVELQTYKDELEKIRKTVSGGGKSVKVDGEVKSENDGGCKKGGDTFDIPPSSSTVTIKSERPISIKAERDDPQESNFIGRGASSLSSLETPNQPSPLQRIQLIFNSGLMKPTVHSRSPSSRQNTHHHHHNHHHRTPLPPIDQHHLEAHLDINTEELVKKVREFLGRFSISQRLFGEKVLGLSQGSVSDLLARPKPWCVLTQKGREPFARMKMFLEDQDGIMTKLLASQCKVMTSVAMTTPASSSSVEECKTSLEFPKVSSNQSQMNMPMLLSHRYDPSSNLTNQIHRDKSSTYQQSIASHLSAPIPLKIPLQPSSPLHSSPRSRSPWSTPACNEALNSTGYLGNFPFSSFLPSVLSMIGNSTQNIPANPLTPYLSPSPFFPLMVPGYPSIHQPSNVLRSLPYNFTLNRPGVDSSLPVGENQDQLSNGNSRSSSRHDTNFLSSSPFTFNFGNSQERMKQGDDDGRMVKEEKVMDLTSSSLDQSHDNNSRSQDMTLSNMSCDVVATTTTKSNQNDSEIHTYPYSSSLSSFVNSEKMKTGSDFPFRDVHQFELDTQAITARVKELLQQSNLGQKLFGEAVLELSQGSVSELLSKPKPWSMLSLKGREPFIKMNSWLADPNGVEKLRNFHLNNNCPSSSGGANGSCGGRGGGGGGGGKLTKRKTTSEADSPSSTSSTLPQQSCRTGFGSGDGEKVSAAEEEQKRKKRPRLFFTEEQKAKLREAYNYDPYPPQTSIERLAKELNVGSKTIVNWFHNHRMRAKQVFASVANQRVFPTALVSIDGKTETQETPVEDETSFQLDSDSEKKPIETSEGAEVSAVSCGISTTTSFTFNKRKRSKPLKVPEVHVTLENSLTEIPTAPSESAKNPLSVSQENPN